MKRIATAVLSAAAMGLAAQSAAAVALQVPASHDSATCQLSALAAFTPGIPVLSASLQQSSGSYMMGADGVCVKADGDQDERTANSNVYSVHMSSSGSYFSNLCGSLLTLYAG